MDDTKKDTDLGWENRVLCSDESCIGVIGPDGCCSECGLAYQGQLPPALTGDARVDEEEAPETDEAESPADASDTEQTASDDSRDDTDEEWARRKLCRDESCIGVIGPDGRCKECGKPE